MQIKKIFFIVLIIINTGCRKNNEKDLSNKNYIVNFQKELIKKEITLIVATCE